MTDKEEEAVAMEVDAAPDAAAAAPAAAEQEAEPSGTAEATTEDTPAGPSAEPEMVEPEVKADLLAQLVDMGFGRERAVRALHFSGNSTLEGAINWLEQHAEDADLDEPLLLPKSLELPKKLLTPEEAKAKALELQAKAKAKREAADRASAIESEKLRVRMGKEMAAVARIEEDQKMKRIADERVREKQEEARAKDKIRLKLEEDRKERRRKQGLPEDLTPEEQAEADARRTEREEAEKKQKLNIVRPVVAIAAMRECLVTMKKQTPDAAKYLTCCKTLTAYCRNVFLNIEDLSKRRIKLENKALQERVLPLPGGLEFLNQVGFEKNEAEGCLEMPKQETVYEQAVLKAAAEVLDSAMNNPMFGVL